MAFPYLLYNKGLGNKTFLFSYHYNYCANIQFHTSIISHNFKSTHILQVLQHNLRFQNIGSNIVL